MSGLIDKISTAIEECNDKKYGSMLIIIQYENLSSHYPNIIATTGRVTKYQKPFVWLITRIFQLSLKIDQFIRWANKKE